MKTLQTTSRIDALAEKQLATWLKENSLTKEQLETEEMWRLHAHKTATSLLKKHFDKLDEKQQYTLMNFCMVMMNSRTRNSITKHMSYEVMNIGKKIKRTEYKASKQTAKARRKIQSKRQSAVKI